MPTATPLDRIDKMAESGQLRRSILEDVEVVRDALRERMDRLEGIMTNLDDLHGVIEEWADIEPTTVEDREQKAEAREAAMEAFLTFFADLDVAEEVIERETIVALLAGFPE